MRNPDFIAAEISGEKPARPATFDITRDTAAFRRLVRTAIFGFLQDVAARDWESAASRLATGEAGGTAAENVPASPEAKRIAAAFASYFDSRGRFRLDPEGRSAKHTHWLDGVDSPPTGEWRIAQVLIDADEQNDWEVQFTVPLGESRAENRAVLKFENVAAIGV
jgi:hypothetical protein